VLTGKVAIVAGASRGIGRAVALELARDVVVREMDAELAEWEVDEEATEEERKKIRENRIGWLEADAEELARRYRDGEIGALEQIRRHGVILDWGTGELLPKTTEGFRAMLKRRVVPHWEHGAPKD
jgi:N-methylhydantoinase B